MKEYVYKIVHKFVKKPFLLAKYGFNPYIGDDDEQVIAKPITLPLSCDIVTNVKKIFEHIYKIATPEEKENDFKDYTFNEDGTVVFTPELQKELTECQLCFYIDGVGKYQFFINAPDNSQYFNTKVLDESIPEIIDELIKNKIIYKRCIK